MMCPTQYTIFLGTKGEKGDECQPCNEGARGQKGKGNNTKIGRNFDLLRVMKYNAQ